jgi:hypothetical protein
MEIYNRHAYAKKDKAGLLALLLKLTSPPTLEELHAAVRDYPDELFASQVEYPAEYLAKWDRETLARRLTGVAANDCHHNMVMIVKMASDDSVSVGTIVDKDSDLRTISARLRPGIREITRNHKVGDILARVDLDPYHRSFRNVSTHILAPELSERAIRRALSAGHVYVAHDWMCDPTGFSFELTPMRAPGTEASSGNRVMMGDEVMLTVNARLVARFPVSCHIRLLEKGHVIAQRRGERLEHEVTKAGVYRVEGWLEVGGEERGWIYSNPIYVR